MFTFIFIFIFLPKQYDAGPEKWSLLSRLWTRIIASTNSGQVAFERDTIDVHLVNMLTSMQPLVKARRIHGDNCSNVSANDEFLMDDCHAAAILTIVTQRLYGFVENMSPLLEMTAATCFWLLDEANETVEYENGGIR